jgi:putative ABC transport system permease protein
LLQFDVQAEIIGVVGHVKEGGLGTDPKSAVEAQFFYPFMQLPEKIMRLAAGGVAVVLRVVGDPAAIMKQVRQEVTVLDSRGVIYGVQTMNEVLAGSLAPRRFSMILLGIFAVLALVLSCVGIYGVISHVVGQRTHEIGVRMALGAQRIDVIRLVVGEGARIALLGVAIGIGGALGLTRLLASQLFDVTAQDPLTFISVAALLALVALLACYLPARRAMCVDPVMALRCE